MLWLHLARSGIHFGKHSAEELSDIANHWHIKESKSEAWPGEETRHLDVSIPKVRTQKSTQRKSTQRNLKKPKKPSAHKRTHTETPHKGN